MNGPSHIFRILTVFLVIAAGLSPAAGSPPEERRLNLESFDYVWRVIRDKHFDPDLGGLDWESVCDELRPRVERASNVPEARAVMEEMVLLLGQSHFNIIPAQVYEVMGQPDAGGLFDGSLGIDTRVIDGQAIVVSVFEGSPADAAGVRSGWEILRVGEDDARTNLEMIAREYEGSTWKDAILAGAVQSRLIGRIGETVRIVFRDGADREITRELTMVEARGRKIRHGHLPSVHVWEEVERVDGDIGYVAFNMFLDPTHLMPTFNDAMKSFMGAGGIIIDVRGNPGGLPEIAMGMAGWLVHETGSRLGTLYTRDNELRLVANPRPATYGGPVAVLVDGLSGSASEFFAEGLKDLGRAHIIGTRTAGGALASIIERLPNGDGFQYAFGNFVSASGKSLEGNGVIPHVQVAPSREALLQGRDPALEAAVAWIRSQK